jgi:hypothetical protein
MSHGIKQLAAGLAVAKLLGTAGCVSGGKFERQECAKVAQTLFEERCK